MGVCEDILEKVRADVERLEQEVAIIRQELNENPSFRKGISTERSLQLLLKENEFNLMKQVCQCMELTQISRIACEPESLTKEKLRQQIHIDLGEYARSFHSHIADTMELSWPDLACALSDELHLVQAGDWWGAQCHVELFGHLEDLGFTMELWECSLQYGVEYGYHFMPRLYEDECAMKAQLRKDKEFLNSEAVRQFLLPEEFDMFTKLVKEYEVYYFL